MQCLRTIPNTIQKIQGSIPESRGTFSSLLSTKVFINFVSAIPDSNHPPFKVPKKKITNALISSLTQISLESQSGTIADTIS